VIWQKNETSVYSYFIFTNCFCFCTQYPPPFEGRRSHGNTKEFGIFFLHLKTGAGQYMPIGIDFLHVVEFSRYECTPGTAISHRLQGRPPNLVEGTRKSKSGRSFIVLGNTYRCLALFTPVLKGFSSNSQARGKDSPCLEKGQIPFPEKPPK